ncbi:MAG: dihydrofolate reductase [Flavobacteriales bacterium]
MIYLTRIHAKFNGDTFFPEINKNLWKIEWQDHYSKDEKHSYSFDIMKLVRV